MITNKSRNDVDWRALYGSPTIAQNFMDQVLTILDSSSTWVPHRSGKIIIDHTNSCI